MALGLAWLEEGKKAQGKKALQNPAAYLIRSSFSQQRMEYLCEEAEVRYQSKDGKEKKTYHALEWLAAMPACACPYADRGTHVPDRGQQCVRYYSYLSNSAQGRRRKQENSGTPGLMPACACPHADRVGQCQADTQGAYTARSQYPFRCLLFPVACVRGGMLLSNSPSTVEMLRRPLLLSAFRLMHPSATHDSTTGCVFFLTHNYVAC